MKHWIRAARKRAISPKNLRRTLAVVTCVMVAFPADLAAEKRPNILFFLSDDQRNDFLGCAGHPILKTPTIDALAKKGVRFVNTFVTTSICAASRASIFTGLHERTHQYTFGTPPIAEKHTDNSYPVLMRSAGYRTGFIGKFGVGVEAGQRERMFDYFRPLNRNPYFKKLPDGSKRHVSEIAGDRAVEFLKSCAESQPFCLSVSFNAAHAEDGDKVNHFPWPAAVDGLYEDVDIPSPRFSAPEVFESQPDFLKKSLNRQRWFWRWDTPEKYQRNVKAYYRMITGLDNVMGRVLKELRRLGWHENTVVVFSGDNGYYKGARGFAGKWSHYEESLRVPLVVFDPRAEKPLRGRKIDAMALNVDLPATFLALAGLEVPATYSGKSLLPWIRGAGPVAGEEPDSAPWREDFFCEHLMNHAGIPKYEGLRGGRYVYARYFEQDPPFEFLHDLKVDPDQLRNFVHDERYAAALEKVRERCAELRDAYGGAYDPSRVKRFREEQQRRKQRQQAQQKQAKQK